MVDKGVFFVKKIISVIIVLSFVLALCACGGEGGGASAGLQMGFAREKGIEVLYV